MYSFLIYNQARLLRLSLFLTVFTTLIIFAGCKKVVDVAPPITSATAQSVYSNDASAIAEMTGVYSKLSSVGFGFYGGVAALSVNAGLGADELRMLPNSVSPLVNIYRNNLIAGTDLYNGAVVDLWVPFYQYIYSANATIAGLGASKTVEEDGKSQLSGTVKRQLLGEAKFVRGFCYFYLVNLYGDVPLVLTTDYSINGKTGRTNAQLVYQQIENDLQEASDLLSSSYLDADLKTSSSSSERIRPVKAAASALLARVFLYEGKFDEAKSESSKVIDNDGLYNLTPDINGVFQKNSIEAIWQLQPVARGINTAFGAAFILPLSGPTTSGFGGPAIFLNEAVVNSFESLDPRSMIWVNSVSVSGTTYHYAFKYKKSSIFDPAVTSPAAMTEYSMVLRLGEQYLIRAEAKARLNDISGAAEDLNVIRTRARGAQPITVLPDIAPTLTLDQMLAAIAHERQTELFTEWGDRWFNLKRTGKIDEVMEIVTPLKSGQNWRPYQALYPIPYADMQYNPALQGQQNPGY